MAVGKPRRIEMTDQDRIQLGRARRLVQHAVRENPGASFIRTGRPIGMPTIEYAGAQRADGELAMQKLAYALEPEDGELMIENYGLCAAYGIFGAPGSGKSHLMLHLLRQLVNLNRDADNRKFGCLILDPKAALTENVEDMVAKAGRERDLVVITNDLPPDRGLNVLNAALDPYDLGMVVSLAAQSAGVSTSDPFWELSKQNLLGAALCVLDQENDAVTMRTLVDAVLTREDHGRGERRIVRIARARLGRLDHLTGEDDRRDVEAAINQIERFFGQESESVSTIQEVITRAYGVFLRSRYACYSLRESRAVSRARSNLYDSILEDGKIVHVCMSPNEPEIARTLCTLIKVLFQRSVLSRFRRYEKGELKNFERPVLLWCDEYAQVASEVPGQLTGDGDFFSQARQFGCMGLLAAQSVNVLEGSSLRQAWKSIFGNFGAKIFMRLLDNETIEEATKLGGESDWYVTSSGTSRSKEGLSTSRQKELRERKNLPGPVLTEVLQKGDAVIIGSLDGSGNSAVRFMRVGRDA